MLSRVLALLVMLVVSTYGGLCLAETPERRVVLSDFQGKQAKGPRAWLITALEKAGMDVAPKAEVFARGEPKSAEAYVALAQQHRLSAFIAGRLRKAARGYTLELDVRNGADGQPMERVEISAPSLAKMKPLLTPQVPEGLAAVLAQTAAPEPAKAATEAAAEPDKPAPAATAPRAAPAATGEDDAAPPDGPDEAVAPAGAGHSMLELALGVRGYSRELTYNDDRFDALTIFRLGAAPAGLAALRVYPLAGSQRGVLAHIGLAGAFEYGFATTVLDARGRELDVSMLQFQLGLRARVPIDVHELGATVSYGQHRMSVDEPDDRDLVPDVAYEFVRGSLDARFRVSSFLFGFHGGYRALLSMGDFESDQWFPRASGAGIEAGVFVGQALSESFDLLGGFDVERYFFTLNPEPGDPHVAGGALDQHLSLWAALLWRYP
jgi:hypothetical protein